MSKHFGGALVRAGVAGLALSVLTACANRTAPEPAAMLDEANALTKQANPSAGGRAGFSLTVYSTADPATFSPQDLLQDQLSGQSAYTYYAPGFGVVREIRRMKLGAGVNRLEFADVAAGIDPTTVSFRSLAGPNAAAVLEQNFEYDVTSADKLIQKYLGRDVVLTVIGLPNSKAQPRRIVGKLLAGPGAAGSYGSYIVQTEDPATPVAIVSAQSVSSIELAASKTGLVSKPTLNWQVAAEKAGDQDVQITYQTDGLTWRADYNLLVNSDETAADLSAWVTLLNCSGMTYPDAKLKLVAGNVQRFISPERAQRAPAGVSNQLFAGGASPAETGFKEKGFFEYHLYTLGRTTTLPNNSTKQIELFPSKSGIATDKVYVYYGLSPQERMAVVAEPQRDRSFGTESNKQVDIYLRFKNGEANRLGIPLPAGRIRVYKTDPADGSREFIGEDVIQHTPKDEEVMARLGTAFDIVGERVQTDYQDTNHSITESFEITLRNHKDVPVHVIVKENLYRWFNWEITQSSEKWEKKDYRTIHIPVDVPAGKERKITYTVKYSWQ